MIKQTFFEMALNPLGNAEVMLDVCRLEYVKAGRAEDVEEMKSLHVSSVSSARKALLTVWNLPEDANVSDVKRYTVRAMRSAIRALERRRTPVLQLAS